MTSKVRILSLLLSILMVLAVLVSCKTSGDNIETDAETEKPKVTINLMDGKKFKYKIIRSDAANDKVKAVSVKIRNALKEKFSTVVGIGEDTIFGTLKPGEFEILVGMTNREESAQILGQLKYHDYTVQIVNNKIVILAYDEKCLEKAADHFISVMNSKDTSKPVTFSTEEEIFVKEEYKFDTVKFDETDLQGYTIIIPTGGSGFMRDYAHNLQSKIIEVSGLFLPVRFDSYEETAKEILVGDTNRKQSKTVDSDSLGTYGYSVSKVDDKIIIKTNDRDYTFLKTINLLSENIEKGEFKSIKGKIDDTDKLIMNAFCFTDVHNNWAMMEPPYVIRQTVPVAIDTMLRDYGKMDIVFVGGDLMSDYPHWDASGWLPYKFYTEYKALLVKEFARLAKDEMVHYTAGNHDYGQGEKYDSVYNELVGGGGPGPGKNGSYNSYEFYFTGPMDKTFGVLPEEDMCVKVSKYTGEKYLLSFYYELDNGIGVFGLAPDPDLIWDNQAQGFSKESLKWLKEKLDEVDPNGNKVMFLNCHYVIHQRSVWNKDKTDVIYPTYGVDMTDEKIKPDDLRTGTGDAPELAAVLNGHRNLFHLFGHAETWLRGYTSTAIFHYNSGGNIIPLNDFRTDNSIGITTYDNRGFNSVYMGHFRPAPSYAGNQGWADSWFENDAVRGYGGSLQHAQFHKKWAQSSTGTPKISQGLYIEVYEDRIVFDMKNFGSFDGWRYEDKNVTYTMYLYK